MDKPQKILLIKEKIQAAGFNCLHVKCQSEKHLGHQGYSTTGSHFEAIVKGGGISISKKIAAQKKIMEQFIDVIPKHIHALTLKFQSSKTRDSQ